MATPKYIAGVEGGATHSNLVICDSNGKVLAKAKGPGTNHWNLGIDECSTRILAMVHAAKKEAGISSDTPLDSLGLTLSGCEQESSDAELAARVCELDASCARAIYVASDTAGSLATAAPSGGLVLIAGTGSNALLKNPNGETRGCGGWGHLLGDEGAAYWIAHRAVKTVFDEMDGLHAAPHGVDKIWETMQEHFNIHTQGDLLPHCYKHFDKSKFAGITMKLAELATRGDAMCLHIFAEAGRELGAHVAALARRSAARLRPLRVVCVGSVFQSWPLLKGGALAVLRERNVNIDLEFVRLRVTSAMGAAWLAAKHIGYELPRDDSAYCDIFYTYSAQHANTNTPSFTHKNGVNTNGLIETCQCLTVNSSK